LGPRTKKENRKKKSIKIYQKNNSSEKRISKRPENGKELVEEAKKYKDWNLAVYR
jgi:hypothetical protein